MQRIVITIEDGQLTGVFTDGEEEIIVELIDYDNIKMSDDPTDDDQAKNVEIEVKTGKLKPCW